MLSKEFLFQLEQADKSIVLFSIVRNEMLRLPSFLEHYRKMGVPLFAFVDNGSTDGTLEFLQNQTDTIVMISQESYAASGFGMKWLNEFHSRSKPGTWIVHADADEFVVYEGWPDQQIQTYLSQVEQTNANAVMGFMLDMYPDGPLETSKVNGEGLLTAAPCFDNEYHFRIRPDKPWRKTDRVLEVVGGPRTRLLSSFEREVTSNWIDLTIRGQISRLLRYAPRKMVPMIVRYWPKQLPEMLKYPFVRCGLGVEYASPHYIQNAVLFDRNVVVCHFKFLADFAERVRVEVKRGEHYRGGAEYMMYLDAIEKAGYIDLRYPGTVRFAGVDQLVHMGLIRDLTPFRS